MEEKGANIFPFHNQPPYLDLYFTLRLFALFTCPLDKIKCGGDFIDFCEISQSNDLVSTFLPVQVC